MLQLKLPANGSLKTFGYSMLPLLQDGDIVYFHKIPFSSIKTFDIILVNKNKKYFTHRVIYKTQKYLITKGDDNNYSDGRILPSQIVGRVYQIKRNKDIFPVESLSLVQNASYLQEIGQITDLFQKNHIDFVFLKGLPIYLFYTKEMPKRIYADCDTLVAEKDFTRAKNILLANGFHQQINSSFLAKFLEPHLMEEDFIKTRGNYPIMIDLHKRPFSYIRKLDFPDSLYPKRRMDRFNSELFRTKRWVEVSSIKIPIPDKDYLLLFLSLHFFTHTMKMMHRLWLIKEVVRKDKKTPGSWSSFVHLTSSYQMDFMVYPAFYFVNKLYNKIIPSLVLRQIKPTGNADEIYKLKTDLVFDERVDLSRVINKIYISWAFSPQSFFKRLSLLVSPTLLLLLLTYIKPIRSLVVVDIKKLYRNKLRKMRIAV